MRHALTALALALPLPALAQDAATVGTMNGTLDGLEVTYAILDGEDARTSWREAERGGIEVSLTARPSAGQTGSTEEIALAFTTDSASRDAELLNAEMALSRNGETLTATGEAVNIEFDNLGIADNSLLITGTLRATLGAGDENLTVVAEEGTTLTAEFQATIIRAEDTDEQPGS